MSAYSEQQTQFSEASLLVKALESLGLTVIQHATAQTFTPWTEEKADIVIPQTRYGHKSGQKNPGYYAAGFKRNSDGKFGALVSVEDSQDSYNGVWMNKVKQSYAQVGLMRQAEKQGLKFVGIKTRADGSRAIQYQQA